MLTLKRLRELLAYNPDTGVFTWRVRRGGKATAGSRAGTESWSEGCGRHRRIGVDGLVYYEHRLAWLYMTGDLPSHDIDHRDLDGTNNSWSNLRPATDSLNNANRRLRPNNSTGYKGVHRYRNTGKFVAAIRVNRKGKHLGIFDTAFKAHEAYLSAAKDAFGEYVRTA